MGEDQLAILLIFGLPVIAVVGGLCTSVIKSLIASNERRFELRMMAQQSVSDNQGSQIQALRAEMDAMRAELASLRETSTQFDISLDKTHQGIQDRMARLEQRVTAPRTVAAESENVEQTIGGR